MPTKFQCRHYSRVNLAPVTDIYFENHGFLCFEITSSADQTDLRNFDEPKNHQYFKDF